ncbi:DUF3278 domain-containing protein [Lacticaseibacillus daqingensis]|uniref:DUF3278 domain-containing protein n=1 Tax=Lacticaseibacillus daqingensis TaxID=2486014 RepID=UPI000F76A0A4|nr:DUF3278 domain-containing protein [Lacticaseibacillus daqingensis]
MTPTKNRGIRLFYSLTGVIDERITQIVGDLSLTALFAGYGYLIVSSLAALLMLYFRVAPERVLTLMLIATLLAIQLLYGWIESRAGKANIWALEMTRSQVAAYRAVRLHRLWRAGLLFTFFFSVTLVLILALVDNVWHAVPLVRGLQHWQRWTLGIMGGLLWTGLMTLGVRADIQNKIQTLPRDEDLD